MTREEKLRALADLITREQLAEHNRNYPDYAPGWETHATATIKQGARYTRIDIGLGDHCSGRYMVDAQGNILGIKGYGVINHKYWFGTLDTIGDYWWGGYRAVKKDTIRRITLTRVETITQ